MNRQRTPGTGKTRPGNSLPQGAATQRQQGGTDGNPTLLALEQ